MSLYIGVAISSCWLGTILYENISILYDIEEWSVCFSLGIFFLLVIYMNSLFSIDLIEEGFVSEPRSMSLQNTSKNLYFNRVAISLSCILFTSRFRHVGNPPRSEMFGVTNLPCGLLPRCQLAMWQIHHVANCFNIFPFLKRVMI